VQELADLGRRIMICGPSNAGKSTLAVALSRKLGIPAIHLDVLWHEPNTNWVPRPRELFAQLHADAISGDAWIIDGNYFGFVQPRLERASGIVLVGSDRWSAFLRYLRRTLFEPWRPGNLEGAKDSLKWDMVRYILVEQPRKRQRDIGILAAAGLPMVTVDSIQALNSLYTAWALPR